MNLLGMDKVINNLQTGKISSDKQLWYLILSGGGGVQLLGYLYDFIFSGNFNNSLSLNTDQMVMFGLAIITFIGALFGFLNCYWINQRRDNQDFILRYTTLSATIFWRLFFLFLPIPIAIFCLIAFFGQHFATIEKTLYASWLSLVATLIYFACMNLAFAKVAGKKRG
jgi:hypothetical protein